jgi:hypothetical protein
LLTISGIYRHKLRKKLKKEIEKRKKKKEKRIRMKRKEKSFKKQKTQRPFKTMSYASGFSIPNSFRSADKFKVSNAVRKKIQELQLVGITPLEYTSPYYHSELHVTKSTWIKMCRNKDLLPIIVQENGLALRYTTDFLKRNKKIVMAAVANNVSALSYASGKARAFLNGKEQSYEQCCSMQQVILTMLMIRIKSHAKKQTSAWSQIPTFLRLHCLSYLPVCLDEYDWYASHTSTGLKGDREVVLGAGVGAFQHSSLELRNDKELTLVAVSKSGLALEYASNVLKNDFDVVLVAMKQLGWINYESESKVSKTVKDLMIEAVRMSSGHALALASDELRNDPDVLARCQ